MKSFNKNFISVLNCSDNDKTNFFFNIDNYRTGLLLKIIRYEKTIKKEFSSYYFLEHKRKKSFKQMEKIFNLFKDLNNKESILLMIEKLEFIKKVE